MRKILLFILLLFTAIPGLRAEEIEVTSELSFTASRVEEEPDPNNNEYVFALFGNADGVEYKVQIDYHADNVFGTFSDPDFDLTGSGKNYNYIRTADGSKLWQFKHLDVTVASLGGGKHLEINGLIQVYGEWRRVLVSGNLEVEEPSETINVDLGTVAVIPNAFLGYVLLEAGNAAYSLTTGISGYTELKPGTYYRTEIVHPDFIRLPADTIETASAQLEVKARADGEMDLSLDLLSEDNVLYKISMQTGEPAVLNETDIECTTASLNDYVAEYNMYQVVGENSEYQVALAVDPSVIDNDLLVIAEDKVNVAFTQILRKADAKLFRVCKASGRVEVAEDGSKAEAIYASLLATDGTLFHVTFPFADDIHLDDDAIIVECGDYVGRLDFTKAPGWMGMVVGNDDADVHVTVANGLLMKGTFTKDMFDYKDSYVTTYENNNETIRFADVTEAELHMDSVDNYVNIELVVMTVNNQQYCFRARLVPMQALSEATKTYSVDAQDADMVCFRMETDGAKASYRLQFQRYDGLDEDGLMVGNAEIWDFRFTKDDLSGISGDYGYAAGTLDESSYHYIFENNCEILVGPMAGTLKIVAGEEFATELFEQTYHTHIYTVKAQIAAKNGIIYELNGDNILLCVDYDTFEPIEFSEGTASEIRAVLTTKGIGVRKVLKNGIIILESKDGDYFLNGCKR